MSNTQQRNHCHEDKQNKAEKQKKKALYTAYRANPNDFEQEPFELHSDVDVQEDVMVSVRPSFSQQSSANTHCLVLRS